MNFDNLFAVECNVRCDQNKLQSILKTFEDRMRQVEAHINTIDRRCQHLELNDTISGRKFDKLESFTIDSLMSTIDKISFLNFSVSKYIGKDHSMYETCDGTIVPIDPKRQFEDKLAQYSKQIQEIANHKLVKTQLSFSSSLVRQQYQNTPSKVVTQKYSQFDMIADQVKKIINQKFQEYKQELAKGKKVLFNNDVQNFPDRQLEGHRPSVSKFVEIQNFRDSIHENSSELMRPSMLQLLQGEGMNNSTYRNFAKLQSNMEFQDVKNDDDVMSKKNKNYNSKSSAGTQDLRDELSKIKDTLNKEFTNNSQKVNQTQLIKLNQDKQKQAESFSIAALQEMAFTIKQQMRQLIKNQLSKMSQKIQDVTNKSELTQSNMTFILKEFRLYKNDLEKLFMKNSEIEEKISSSVSQIEDKHLNLAGRIRQHEMKINQIEIASLNQNTFKQSDYAQEGSVDGRKFREIGNFKKNTYYDPINVNLNTGSGVRLVHAKNQSTGSNSALEGPIINKLNSLSEKISKIQEKLKVSSVNPTEKNLPKIDAVNSSSKNIQSSLLEQLRKDMSKTNQQLAKTNEKVQWIKKSVHDMESANQQIPKQMQKIQMDLHNINQIQENRLIELIKDIINKVLTDPFNNNFTNVLKRQINAKFLQIKHEYASIMKDIESRVMDRADVGQLQKIKDFVETNAIELKTLMLKKADNEDFKKGLKYLDQKLKDLYAYVKEMEEQDIANNNPRPQTQSSAYTRSGFLRSKKQP